MPERRWWNALGELLGLCGYCKRCRLYKWLHFRCASKASKDIANEFFLWLEDHQPLEEFWDVGNAQSGHDQESYPYSYFREIAMRKLTNLIKRYYGNRR